MGTVIDGGWWPDSDSRYKEGWTMSVSLGLNQPSEPPLKKSLAKNAPKSSRQRQPEIVDELADGAYRVAKFKHQNAELRRLSKEASKKASKKD